MPESGNAPFTRGEAKDLLVEVINREILHLKIQLKYPTLFHPGRTQSRIDAITSAMKLILEGDDND